MEYGDESTIVSVQEQVGRLQASLMPAVFRSFHPRDTGVSGHVHSDQRFVCYKRFYQTYTSRSHEPPVDRRS